MTTITEPVPQHMQALARANRIRYARADTKRWLRAAASRAESLERLGELLREPGEHLFGMTVWELAAACRRMGPTAVERLLRQALIHPARRKVGNLTPAERARVLAAIDAAVERHR